MARIHRSGAALFVCAGLPGDMDPLHRHWLCDRAAAGKRRGVEQEACPGFRRAHHSVPRFDRPPAVERGKSQTEIRHGDL